MKMLPGFQRKRRKKGIVAASSLLLLFATETIAQSGRRAPRPTQPPVTTPQADSDASSKSARDLKQKVSLLVGIEPSSKRLLSETAIFQHCVAQLLEFKNVAVSSLGDVDRDAAVKRAKLETDSIVVLLQFDVDEFQSGTIILNPQDLDVRVSIFEPKTGKKRFEGHVYYKAASGPNLKRDNWPNGTPIRITTEAVGIEAAEQVHDWLIVESIRKKN